jgi:hypothetical protein
MKKCASAQERLPSGGRDDISGRPSEKKRTADALDLIQRFKELMVAMMTLLAFIVVLGMLDDDSVVVAQSIYRHLEMGKSPTRAAIEGVREVAFIEGMEKISVNKASGGPPVGKPLFAILKSPLPLGEG